MKMSQSNPSRPTNRSTNAPAWMKTNQQPYAWGGVNLTSAPNSNVGYQGINYLSGANPNMGIAPLDYSVAPTASSGFGTINQQPLALNQNSMGIGITPTATPDTFLGMGAQGWGNTINGIQALGNMYLGYQGLQEGKKHNKFSRNLASTNLANQATLVNNQLEKEANRSYIQQQGGVVADRGAMSEYSDNYVKQRGVRGTV